MTAVENTKMKDYQIFRATKMNGSDDNSHAVVEQKRSITPQTPSRKKNKSPGKTQVGESSSIFIQQQYKSEAYKYTAGSIIGQSQLGANLEKKIQLTTLIR